MSVRKVFIKKQRHRLIIHQVSEWIEVGGSDCARSEGTMIQTQTALLYVITVMIGQEPVTLPKASARLGSHTVPYKCWHYFLCAACGRSTNLNISLVLTEH